MPIYICLAAGHDEAFQVPLQFAPFGLPVWEDVHQSG
ncbi:hypothetical protein CKAH01_18722 [Colletotrichum kahawae]|uniref:Uncharacterized protein n=1 Tax=Colletotrichum kahawae TaxID=34407 RepID=A0AAD9Y6T1_COLKA|nr:hypothetical protein CKAH01_18722 [Colletotrichum kahawae]